MLKKIGFKKKRKEKKVGFTQKNGKVIIEVIKESNFSLIFSFLNRQLTKQK